MAERIAHVRQACFAGRAYRCISGGNAKVKRPADEIRGIRDGGGNGRIIGRNTFQRPRGESIETA